MAYFGKKKTTTTIIYLNNCIFENTGHLKVVYDFSAPQWAEQRQ